MRSAGRGKRGSVNEKRLDEIRKRAKKAVQGPWYAQDGIYCRADGRQQWIFHTEDGDYRHSTLSEEESEQEQRDNEAFVAHARTDIPDLLAYVEMLKKKVNELEDYNSCLEDEIRNLS